jgi:pimeloyl-ACP methyl ester carboxylesterase
VFLHGGWGYEIYPFDRQVEAFTGAGRFKVIIPDRSGYGRSRRVQSFPVDFHVRAATETLSLLNALRQERVVLWGHSDGAVIAALLALSHPERVAGILFEAFHYYKVKPASRQFFEGLVANPLGLGGRVTEILAREHGQDYWQQLLMMGGTAWLELADQAADPEEDLYGGRLKELKPPCLFLHGSSDPRTEPGELAAVERELPGTLRLIEGAGHSPHSENGAAAECNRLAGEFLGGLALG